MTQVIDKFFCNQMRIHDRMSFQICNTNEETSTTKLNGLFLLFQLLIDILFRFKSYVTNRKFLVKSDELIQHQKLFNTIHENYFFIRIFKPMQ